MFINESEEQPGSRVGHPPSASLCLVWAGWAARSPAQGAPEGTWASPSVLHMELLPARASSGERACRDAWQKHRELGSWSPSLFPWFSAASSERTSEGGSREHSATLSSPFLGPPGSLAFPSSSSFRWGAATSEDWQERASPTGESFITEMADRRLTGNVCHSGEADVSAKYAC